MNVEQNLIQDTLTNSLNLTTNGHDIYCGQWVIISFEEWKSHLKKKALKDNLIITSIPRLKFEFLDFVIEKINSCRFGAGCNYELYEQRRQEEIGLFLSEFSLTSEEAGYFKERVGFIEDFSPYTTQCEECNGEVSALDSAKSLQMEGEELCARCLNLRYC